MITETYEPESLDPLSSSPESDDLAGSYIDFDFDIENTGGPIDGGGGSHSGSNPPPEV